MKATLTIPYELLNRLLLLNLDDDDLHYSMMLCVYIIDESTREIFNSPNWANPSFTPLGSRRFKEVFRSDKPYSQLKQLISNGIIERFEKYFNAGSKESYPMSYRIAPIYEESSEVKVQFEMSLKVSKVYQSMIKTTLPIIADEHISIYEHINSIRIKQPPGNITYQQQRIINKINRGESTMKFITAGRLWHTQLGVSRDYKNCVYSSNDINNEWKYVSLDISNMQWLLICPYIKANCEVLDIAEYDRFYDICSRGELYDVISEELNIPRPEVKELMVKEIIFGRWKQSSVYKYLMNVYPSIMRCINNMKSGKDGPSIFAVGLQTIEAKGVIETALQVLAPQCKFIFPRHDEFICTKDDQDLVEATLKETFYRLYNIKVNVTIKNLGEKML